MALRLAFIITDLGVGGAEAMLVKLISGLDRDRFEPMVVSLMGGGPNKDKIEALGVPVYDMRMKSGRPSLSGGASALGSIHGLLKRFNPGLIQGWMYHGNIAAEAGAFLVAPLSRKSRPPVLWNIRGSHTDLSAEKKSTASVIKLGARLSKRPVKIINNSRVSAELHASQLGYARGRDEIIPNGFDTAAFLPSSESYRKIRAELGLPPDALVVGMTGRYHQVKDHPNFLRGVHLLLNKYLKESPAASNQSIYFLLAGTGLDASNAALASQLSVLGLGNRVRLLGERSDMPALTAAFDIATLSSYSEGFPNVIGEAMSCGVPCVATDVGDCSWVIGDTGRLVSPRDADGLAKAWLELIEMGESERAQLGAAARARVIENFSLESVVRRYEELYLSVLS